MYLAPKINRFDQKKYRKLVARNLRQQKEPTINQNITTNQQKRKVTKKKFLHL